MSDIGYKAVQSSGLVKIDLHELRAILDGEGLQPCAPHEPSDTILEHPNAVVERLRKLRCTHSAYPHPADCDLTIPDQVQRLAEKLDWAGEVFNNAGQVTVVPAILLPPSHKVTDISPPGYAVEFFFNRISHGPTHSLHQERRVFL